MEVQFPGPFSARAAAAGAGQGVPTHQQEGAKNPNATGKSGAGSICFTETIFL